MDSDVERAQQGYRDPRTATAYDRQRFTGFRGRIGNWLDRRALRRALRGLDLSGPVLDAPAGTGRLWDALRQAGAGAIVAADVSHAMLHQRNAPEATWRVVANLRQLPMPAGACSAGACIRFMGHFPASFRAEVLAELARVCRSGVVVEYWMQPRSRSLEGLVRRCAPSPLPQRWPAHTPTWDEVRDEAGRTGLRIVRVVPKLRGLSIAHFVVFAPVEPRR